MWLSSMLAINESESCPNWAATKGVPDRASDCECIALNAYRFEYECTHSEKDFPVVAVTFIYTVSMVYKYRIDSQ